jgi:hypothetical protein
MALLYAVDSSAGTLLNMPDVDMYVALCHIFSAQVSTQDLAHEVEAQVIATLEVSRTIVCYATSSQTFVFPAPKARLHNVCLVP